MQVLGRKLMRLVPPWELPRVRNNVHCFSGLTLEELDGGDPDLPVPIKCALKPGEALFLPAGWWHHVEALDVSISMSFTNFPDRNDFSDTHPLLS